MEEKIDQILVYSLLAAKNVLTLEDAALLTGLSKSHLYRLTCTHQIPFYKPNGKQIYFDRIELEAWMKQNRVATQQETGQKAVNYVVTGNRREARYDHSQYTLLRQNGRLHGIRENTQIRNNNRGGVLPTDGKNNRQGRQGINVFTGEQG